MVTFCVTFLFVWVRVKYVFLHPHVCTERAQKNQTLFVYVFVACIPSKPLLRHGFSFWLRVCSGKQEWCTEYGKVLYAFACIMHLEPPICHPMIQAPASAKRIPRNIEQGLHAWKRMKKVLFPEKAFESGHYTGRVFRQADTLSISNPIWVFLPASFMLWWARTLAKQNSSHCGTGTLSKLTNRFRYTHTSKALVQRRGRVGVFLQKQSCEVMHGMESLMETVLPCIVFSP